MIRFFIIFLFRVLFLPVGLVGMLLTAIMEYMSPEPNWYEWKAFNQSLIDILPWSKYK